MPLKDEQQQHIEKEDRDEVWIDLDCGLSITWEGLTWTSLPFSETS